MSDLLKPDLLRSVFDSIKTLNATADRLVKGLALVLEKTLQPQYRGPSMNFFQESGGQFQFSAAGPTYRPVERTGLNDPGIAWAAKAGAVFVEAAPPDPRNPGTLDWSKSKVVFAMSDKDIGEIVWGLKTGAEEVRLVHSSDTANAKENNKVFRLKKEKPFNGSPQWSISLTQKKDKVETRVAIYIKGPDVIRLQLLLESSLSVIMGNNKL